MNAALLCSLAVASAIAPEQTSALVSLRPTASSSPELQLIVCEEIVVVFDPFAGGVVSAATYDPAAIESAVRALTAGNPATVTITTFSDEHATTTFGALATALDAARAAGADRVSYGEYDSYARPAFDALEQGDIKPALVTLRALSATDALRREAAWLIWPLALLVDAKSRPAWHQWLGAHHLQDEDEPTSSTRAVIDEVIARRRHEHGRIAPDHFSWGPAEDRDLDTLVAIRLADVSYEVDAIARGALPIDLASNALRHLFERGDTRATAWAAVRRNANALVKFFDWWSSSLVDGMSLLCEPTSKMEAVGAFALLDLDGIDQALAAIDDCVTRRAQVGDFAAVLASSPD